jgi:hypothetical protein
LIASRHEPSISFSVATSTRPPSRPFARFANARAPEGLCYMGFRAILPMLSETVFLAIMVIAFISWSADRCRTTRVLSYIILITDDGIVGLFTACEFV